jgi:hypothetical protein
VVQTYNDSDMAFRVMTAFKPSVLSYQISEPRYFSNTPAQSTMSLKEYQDIIYVPGDEKIFKYRNMPEVVPDVSDQGYLQFTQKVLVEKQFDFSKTHNLNCGEPFEKVALLSKFTHIQSGKDLFVYNTHFGLRKDYKNKSAELLVQVFSEWIVENGGNLETSAIIGGGDHNSFLDNKEEIHMKTIDAQFPIITKDKVVIYKGQETDIPFTETFCTYPYDIVAPFKFSLLDYFVAKNVRVLSKGVAFSPIENELLGSKSLDEVKGLEDFKGWFTSYVEAADQQKTPLNPSDHFPLVVKIQLE